ncbi:Integrase/recombinase XerD [Deinococcus saxicola]|uniref:tyrosine-type recombinase/integrase n=1 Tax=Deinococcus saxicola TaxID=249406 RepID=UPI0039F12A54
MNTLLEATNPSPEDARTTLVRSSGPQSWRDKPDAALRRDALRLLGQLRENASEARPVWESFFDAALGDSVGSAHTRRSYQQGAWIFVQWALSGEGGVDLLRPARRDGQRYLGWLRSQRPGQPYRPATLQVRIVAARAVMSALRWAGLGEARDPFEGVRVRADGTPSVVSRPPYGDPELAALRTLAESLDPEDRRLWVLTLLCLHAGLRVAEALALTPDQIEGGGRLLRLTGKGGKMRQVPLSQQLTTELSTLSAPDGRYFGWSYNDVTYRMKGVMANSGLIWRGFHGLRKACATRLYEATGDFTRVGLFLGHASADTTRRYVAVRADDLSRYVDGWTEDTY